MVNECCSLCFCVSDHDTTAFCSNIVPTFFRFFNVRSSSSIVQILSDRPLSLLCSTSQFLIVHCWYMVRLDICKIGSEDTH